jgi:hypothetical protein
MSSSNPTLVSARFGTSRNGFDVQLLKFPRSDAALLEKVQAFSYFEEVIRQHSSQLTNLTIQQAYASNIPVSSTAGASEEANRIFGLIYDAFFSVSNITCLGFFKSDGTPVPVSLDPSARAADIAFVSFSATLNLASFSSALTTAVSSPTVQYYLKLPQSNIPTAAADAPPIAHTTADDPSSDDDDSAIANANKTPPATPGDTKAMTSVRNIFARGGGIDQLDMSSPRIVQALAAIIHTPANPNTPRQLFPIGGNSPLPAASPSIRRYLTSAASTPTSSFCGPLDFLDSQISFDALFPPLDRKPVFVIPIGTASPIALFDADAQAPDAIQACLSECRMLVFKDIIRVDYLGHHNIASADHLKVTVARLRQLTLKFNMRGIAMDGNPDMLFDKYLALAPLLPASHVNIWGINLFTQFWHALGEPLTRRIALLPRYIAISATMFDLTTMTTKDRQMTALRELRSLAVESWTSLQEDKKSMRDMLRELSPHHRTSNHFLESSTNVSSAEATMERYAPENSHPNPFIQSNYQNPAIVPHETLVSDYAPDFRGCLGCGVADHVFRACPMKNDPVTITRFHRNFNIKFNRPQRDPSSQRSTPRSSYGPARGPQLSFEPPSGNPPAFGQGPSPGAGRGASRNTPAWMSQQQHLRTGDDSSGNPGPPNPDPAPPGTNNKKARNFPLFVRSCPQQVATSPSLRPMPIRVDNGLPHLRLNLGLHADATLSVLFDSGAALSSGYLPYHLWIMRENPDIVASFEQFDDSNPFEPIKLGGAIRHPDDYDVSLHGQLTAIIRYKTPYVDHDGSPIRISFGLGNDMTVNTILGMPIIKDLGMLPNFRTARVTCEDTPATFDIRYHETNCGFPADDDASTAFANLPVEEMYPRHLAPVEPLAEPPADLPSADSVAAVDDLTHGFLQRHLHSV